MFLTDGGKYYICVYGMWQCGCVGLLSLMPNKTIDKWQQNNRGIALNDTPLMKAANLILNRRYKL